MTRIRTLALVLLACAGLFGRAGAEQRFDGVTLRVATFGGSWRDIIAKETVPKFAAVGGKLEVITGSPQANLAKLIAGRGHAPFDVVDILDAQLPDYLQAHFLADLDLSAIPNTKYLGAGQFSKFVVQDWETQEGVCYNEARFKQLGLKTPTSYADLAQPALAGRVMLPDINSGGGLAAFGAFAYTAGGNEVDFQPGVALLSRIQQPKLWMQGDQVVQAFRAGDIDAAAVHAGWCLMAKKAGVPVVSLHPVIKPGVVGVAKVGWLGVVATSPQRAAAQWYLNTYLDTDVQYAFAVTDGVVPVNREAVAKMGQDPLLASMLLLDPDKIAHELHIDYSKVNMADWIAAWDQMISR